MGGSNYASFKWAGPWGGVISNDPKWGAVQPLLNAQVVNTLGTQYLYVKPSVLSTKGMLQKKIRWAYNGQYPNYWVQPNYTGNQTDSASQWLYIQNKAAANDCWYDVNSDDLYIDYYKSCGSSGCQSTPARGYTMGIQQSNAPYTKNTHRPKDSSAHTLRIQRKCQNPVGLQKPFPYAVQTGTGVLRGGINVNNVASSCNTSDWFLTPPDWYTEAGLRADGTRITKEDQLRAQQPDGQITEERQKQLYYEVFLNGTTGSR
jgi:hypothetical protein